MNRPSGFRPWSVFPSWMNPIVSDYWFGQLNNGLAWERPQLSVYGSSYTVPRMTTFLAEKNISYRYSGYTHFGNGWPSWFRPLLELVNSSCAVSFNGCLLNLYRNGNDRMGWHSDDEIEIDDSKPIASLSFGVSRDFFFKHRSQNFREALSLNHGDLLIMHPDCQKEWLHSVPTRKGITGQRINLTFRCYITNK